MQSYTISGKQQVALAVCTLRYDERYQTSDKMIGNVIYPADSDQLDRGMEYLPVIYMKEYTICTQEIQRLAL